MADMGQLVVQLELQQAQFQKGMDQAARQLAKAEQQTKKTHAALSGLQAGMKGLADVGNALKAAFVGISLGGLVNQMRALVDQVGAIGEQADSVALTTDAFQAFSAALRDAGVNADATAALLGKAARTVGDALEGGKEQIDFFKRLNVGLLDAKGNAAPMADVMQRTAAAILAVEEPAKRVALASQFMGKSGREAIPALEQLAKGAAALAAEFKKEIIPAEVIARFDAFGDKLGQMQAQVRKEAAVAINDFFTPELMAELERLATNIGGLLKSLVASFTANGGAADGFTAALKSTNTEIETLVSWYNAIANNTTVQSTLRDLSHAMMEFDAATANAVASMREFLGLGGDQFRAHAQQLLDQVQIMRDAADELAKLPKPEPAPPAGTVIDMTKKKPGAFTGFPTPKGGGGEDKAAKELEQLKKRAEAIAASVLPQEQYNQTLAELDKLQKLNLLSEQAYQAAKAKAVETRHAERDAILATIDPMFVYQRELAKINSLLAEQELTSKQAGDAVKKLREKLDDDLGIKKMKSMDDMAKELADTMGQAAGDFFGDIISGAATAEEAFKKMAQTILSQIAKLVAEAAAAWIVKSLFSSAGGASAGGASGSLFAAPASMARVAANTNAATFGPSTQAGSGATTMGGTTIGGNKRPELKVVVNNNAGAEVSTRQDESGNLEITIERVRKALSQDVRRGGNMFADTLERSYSMQRRGV